MACFDAANAQKIDINSNVSWADDRITETGFTPWVIGQGQEATTTVDGITITVANAEGSAGQVVKGNWWKQGVQSHSKLVADGVTAYALDADGNTPQIRQGAVAIKFTISGLAAGRHSLMAYHNNTDGYNGPKISVAVDGNTVAEGVEQTCRMQTETESGMSYITFTATEGQPVEVVYTTVPDPGTDYSAGYNTTSLFVNALVFDRPNPATTASEPQPANGDMHAAAQDNVGGSVTLAWTKAQKAVKHHVYLGTDKDNLQKVGETTAAAELVKDGLSTLDTYYWRVDEEDAGGNLYPGEVWTFRTRHEAFPGAEGFGRFAHGGRGGEVYHVTSLDDNPDSPQPGTLRYGTSVMTGPRTIVFDVGGVITLKSRLTVNEKYVTIAGQTAPGQGIMLRGKPFGMQSDGITRFVRARVGGADDWDGHSPNPNTSDGLGMAGNDHSIMDHCSVSWTIDEAFSSRNAKNVTLQRTLISEALNQAGHKNYDQYTNHGYAATIGGDCGSYLYNLLAHCEGRNWSMAGGLDGGGAYAGHIEMAHNVCYNWGGRATDGGTHQGVFVGNYYKMGPATTQKTLLKADLEGTGTGSQSYYLAGNIRENIDGTTTADTYNDTYRYTTSHGQVVDWTVFQDKCFDFSGITAGDARLAYADVLSDVGCNMPLSDNHDMRMVSETLGGTTSTVGSRTGKKGLIDKESDAEGFDGLNVHGCYRPAGFDQDRDGMPDWYEQAAGLSVTAADNNLQNPATGYTMLEEYLDWMARPHFFVKPGETLTFDLKPYFAGLRQASFAISAQTGPEGQDAVVSADGILTMTAATATLMVKIEVGATADGCSLTRSFGVCVAETIPVTETTDGIESVDRPQAVGPQALFSLSGVRVDKPAKGVYVKNGRKVVF